MVFTKDEKASTVTLTLTQQQLVYLAKLLGNVGPVLVQNTDERHEWIGLLLGTGGLPDFSRNKLQSEFAKSFQISFDKYISKEMILEAVAQAYNVSVQEFCGPSQEKQYSAPRGTAMFCMKKLVEPSPSWKDLALSVGRLDHSTAISAVEKVQRSFESDDQELISKLKSICFYLDQYALFRT